jgi:hypothetical protein
LGVESLWAAIVPAVAVKSNSTEAEAKATRDARLKLPNVMITSRIESFAEHARSIQRAKLRKNET